MTARRHIPVSIGQMVKMPFVYPAGAIGGGRFSFSHECHANRRSVPPIFVEVGPGRGDFLFHLAQVNPDKSVVGIEIKRKRVDKLISRVENRGLKNVTIIQDDARCALPRFFSENSVDAIYINFPDPWPKRRHEKNRVLSRDFLEDCCSVLKFYGNLNITTDFRPYAEAVADEVDAIPLLETCYPEPVKNHSDDAYPTLFSQKWINMGRTIYYQKYQRTI